MSRLLRGKDYVRLGVLAAGVLVLSWLAWEHTTALLHTQPLGIDFLPIWAAAHEAFAHPERVYDFVALTQVQIPLLADFHGLRPFVYPPSALLAFAPLGLAPFWAANALWTVAGLAIIVATMAGQVKSQRILILTAMVLSPASVLVMITGQLTFVIAAMVVVGLLSLKTRPILAGVLFGLAGSIKPQTLILLPVAMIAIGQWRVLVSAGVTAALAALASVAVFGLHAWLEWLAAVPRFEHFIMTTPGLQRGVITPTGLGVTLALDPGSLATWRLLFAVGAVALAWFVFRNTQDPARRLAALLGGGLFISPYAMHYDAALLAPAAALMLTHRAAPRAWITALAAGAVLCCAAIPHWGAAAVILFVLMVALTREDATAPALGVPAPQMARGESPA
ncbi:MAG: glycosyltransferase family 87 protein [Caulobacterales bacterium]